MGPSCFFVVLFCFLFSFVFRVLNFVCSVFFFCCLFLFNGTGKMTKQPDRTQLGLCPNNYVATGFFSHALYLTLLF